MMQSMTGYGQSLLETSKGSFRVEVKALNSKQLDLGYRAPSPWNALETQVRTRVQELLERGKVSVAVWSDAAAAGGTASSSTINKPLFLDWYRTLDQLATEVGAPNGQIFGLALRQPGVLEEPAPELGTDEVEAFKSALDQALAQVRDFRGKEGAALEQDMFKHLDQIQKALADLEQIEKKRVPAFKERLKAKLEEAGLQELMHNGRLEQEMIFYTDKLDVNEEIVRLKQHLKYFLQTCGSEGSIGRKLSFIAQEIGREINTLGSKANDAPMQTCVIQMKEELEKIKEQIGNVL